MGCRRGPLRGEGDGGLKSSPDITYLYAPTWRKSFGSPLNKMKNFLFCLWQFCPSEDRPGRWCSCLIHGVPGGIKCIGTGDMALLESFSSFGSWYSKGLPGLSFYIAWHSRQSKVPPDWSPLLFVSMSGTQRDTLSRVFIGQLLALACGKR